MKNVKRKNVLIYAVVCVLLVLFFWHENNHLVVDSFIVDSEKISDALDGFKIVHLSDLHNASFGNGNGKLLEMIENQSPDIVVITGDIVDSNRSNIKIALDFAEKVSDICPT